MVPESWYTVQETFPICLVYIQGNTSASASEPGTILQAARVHAITSLHLNSPPKLLYLSNKIVIWNWLEQKNEIICAFDAYIFFNVFSVALLPITVRFVLARHARYIGVLPYTEYHKSVKCLDSVFVCLFMLCFDRTRTFNIINIYIDIITFNYLNCAELVPTNTRLVYTKLRYGNED